MSELSYLEKLLDGAEVEWLPLGDIANIYGGLTGKSKADFEEGNAKYISYKNIFSNINIDEPPTDFVNINDGERQHTVKYGDVLFTGSSETAEEAGISSAITSQFDEQVYLNSFSFGIRFNKKIKIKPEFSKYLFRTNLMREQISKTASGVTRFNISKSRFKKILIPVISPENQEKSLAIQSKIVRILDKFTALTAELTAELTARKKQYHYYRDQLLSFDEGDVEWKALGDIGQFIRGRRFTKADYVEEGTSVIHYGEIYTRFGVYATNSFSQVRTDMEKSLRYAEPGDVVITDVGETVDDVGKAVAWIGDEKVAIHDHCYAFRHSMNPKFVSYCMQTASFIAEKAKYVARTKVNTLLINGFSKISIPVPYPGNPEKSLAEQARIVAILDKFDALTNSITEGLPREIELRQKQYEYYRDLLFSFPKPESVNH
ncbi:restriction endonuclease subunit S [Morganella morganii subsp. morganii]|uniref:restriction endonuclease subunit S n=1 Tax=Morganella morganii TaxID=582 RepID=UPI001BDAB809|nr:restriction endonuclease subunit S [Morganella morganii]MBT0345886.1 restriction endonuclease subunit S [Morganella morganii subsp. morganii]